MYVSELDRPWIESRFLFQGFEVRTQEELDELVRLCKYVYVETDVEFKDGHVRPRQPASIGTPDPEEFAAKRIRIEILDKFSEHHATKPARYPDLVSLEEELPQAQEIATNANALVENIMHDARFGHVFDSTAIKNSIAGMVQSVLRNPDALLWFSQLKNKDTYTSEHSLRVCILALTFGRHLELPEPDLNMLGIGALLHDIGKVKIPIEILDKPDRLTAEEFELMKQHVPWGVDILSQTPGIPEAAIDVARFHHERYDGSGYTAGLKGEQINLFGQIGAIVDSYDDITSDRPYHQGMAPHDALRKIYEWRRKDFHEILVEQFIQCMGIYPIGSVVEMNTGSVGVVISANRARRLRPRIAMVLDPSKQRYQAPQIIDLIQEDMHGQNALLIQRVLPPGSFDINPADYLPMPR